MSKVIVIDNLPRFSNDAKRVFDQALREAGRDTLINARRAAPFDKGQLRANSVVRALKPLTQRVSFWMEYARFQEFGGDSRRRVRRYTTPGTKAHFLRDAGNAQAKKLGSTLKKHAGRVRA